MRASPQEASYSSLVSYVLAVWKTFTKKHITIFSVQNLKEMRSMAPKNEAIDNIYSEVTG